jgi:hypothetical protein
MVGLGLAKILHWNIRIRLRIVDTARGAVAFLLFLLPKPSVEAEQRQQMVPRATRSTVAGHWNLIDGQTSPAADLGSSVWKIIQRVDGRPYAHL